MQSGSPSEIFKRIIETPPEQTIPEQWCVQRFTWALQEHKIILVSELRRQTVEQMGFLYAKTADEALEIALKLKGGEAKVAVIPDGVAVIVRKGVDFEKSH
jgi:nickel-dependent lactate racemase